MEFYAVLKAAIEQDTGLANTILHIHAGLLILIVARIVTGRSIGSYIPLAAVVVLECGNEVIDYFNHGSWRWADTISDFVNTLFWPVVLTLGIRLRPLREKFTHAPPEPGPDA